MFKHLLYPLAAFILCACNGAPGNYTATNTAAPMFPDYTDITLPYNIAPLNFMLRGGYSEIYAKAKCDADEIEASGSTELIWDDGDWHDFLQRNKGKNAQLDVYGKKDGKWLWAGMNDFPQNHHDANKVVTIVSDMDGTEKECMLYLPIYSELKSCKICIPEGASIEPMASPFRHKIVFHGSSFTHGVSTTRAGMSYPVQFMRRTGMQPITLGFSGNCKMQPYFATVLENVEADAYVFDPFSNPNSQLIKERLMTFIDRMVKAHPGKPLIFQQTIYWERENFNMAKHNEFVERRALVEEMMKAACKKYKDVYFIHPDAALHNGESSTADGVHPNDNGYSVWEKSIEKPILKILKKYGIK